jgi:hypothetical protein
MLSGRVPKAGVTAGVTWVSFARTKKSPAEDTEEPILAAVEPTW